VRQFTQIGKRNNLTAVASHVVGEIRLSQEEGKEEAKTGGREERDIGKVIQKIRVEERNREVVNGRSEHQKQRGGNRVSNSDGESDQRKGRWGKQTEKAVE